MENINSMNEKLLLTLGYPFKKYLWRIHSVPITILGARNTMASKINFQTITKFPGV